MLAQRQLLGPWLPENRLRLIQKCLNLSAAAQELGWSCAPRTERGVCSCAVEPKQSIVADGVGHVTRAAFRGLVTRWYLLPFYLSFISVVFSHLCPSASSVSCV